MTDLEVQIVSGRGWQGLPEPSKLLYQERYFQPGEDYETWLDRVTKVNCDSREHRGRMKQYIRNYWFHPATPVSSNSGLPKQGFPVSCFVQSVADSKDGIFHAYEEAFYLGSRGAGIGSYYGNVRHAGAKVGTAGESSGVIPFMKVSEAFVNAVSQGGLRRASQAIYLPVWHPEIMEFIHLRDPSGDVKRRAPGLFNAVIVNDEFMNAVADRTKYNLIHPKTGEVVESVDAFDVWQAILTMRMTKGTPYILFIDNVNDRIPLEYQLEGWEVETSQLCSEITLRTAPDYSAICVLSSINVEFWDEFYDKGAKFDLFIEDCHRFLDNVLENFLNDAEGERGFEAAVRSGRYERSIGLGIMGLHALYQRKGIGFETLAAKALNLQVTKAIHDATRESNEVLAHEKGANPLSAKHGIYKRNTHVTAIAPTASISTLCGMTSQGVDPRLSNVYTHKTNVGTFNVRNKYLEAVLESYAQNSPEVWASIRNNGGGVAHLDFLSEAEKLTFKPAFQIPAEAIIQQAADRTPYVDQATSTNLFIAPGVDVDYLDAVHMDAWAKGLKSLYYVRSDQPEKVSDLSERKSADDILRKEKTTKSSYEECWYCG